MAAKNSSGFPTVHDEFPDRREFRLITPQPALTVHEIVVKGDLGDNSEVEVMVTERERHAAFHLVHACIGSWKLAQPFGRPCSLNQVPEISEDCVIGVEPRALEICDPRNRNAMK